MSRYGDRWSRKCKGKRPFQDEEHARKAMIWLVRTLRAQNDPVPFFRVYRCEHCGAFHYGRAGGMTRPQMVIDIVDKAMARDAEMRRARDAV